MAFNISQNLDSNNNKIVYDYNNIDIKKENVSFIKNNIEISVTFPVNVPNITYPNGLNNYNATKMYISKLTHKINNITTFNDNEDNDRPLAELTIEHQPITGYGKLYTVFLLQLTSSTTQTNDVDKLLEMYYNDGKSTTLNLNKTIPTQDNCIVYTPKKKKNTTVMVFTTPIYLNKRSLDIYNDYNNKKNIKKTDILLSVSYFLSPNYDTYFVLPKANISQRGEEEIYIDCTPTGESADTIATYNVPIQSEYTRDWGKLDFMKTTIQLLMVFILLLTTYFGVPIMYKRVVVDNINRLISNEIHSIQSKGGRIYAGKQIRNITVDRILFIFSSLIIGFSFMFSVTSKNYNHLQYTVYLFIFGILSLAIIAFNKSSGYFNEGYIIKDLFDFEKYNQKDVNSKIWNGKFIADTFAFLREAFYSGDKVFKNWSLVGGFLTFTYIFLIIFRWGIRSLNHQSFLFLCWFLPCFIVIPSSLIAVLCLYKLDTNPIPKS